MIWKGLELEERVVQLEVLHAKKMNERFFSVNPNMEWNTTLASEVVDAAVDTIPDRLMICDGDVNSSCCFGQFQFEPAKNNFWCDGDGCYGCALISVSKYRPLTKEEMNNEECHWGRNLIRFPPSAEELPHDFEQAFWNGWPWIFSNESRWFSNDE